MVKKGTTQMAQNPSDNNFEPTAKENPLVLVPTWPDFPVGVPPADANSPEGDFFRITNREVPTSKCLESDFQKKPDVLDERSGLELICSYGISVQNTIEGARETVGKFRNATRRRYIAKGSLTADVGKIKQTFKQDYHHTLWVYKDIEIHRYFECFEAVEPK